MDLNTSDLLEPDTSSPFADCTSASLTPSTAHTDWKVDDRFSIETSDLAEADSEVDEYNSYFSSLIEFDDDRSPLLTSDDDEDCYPITYSSDEDESEGNVKYIL